MRSLGLDKLSNRQQMFQLRIFLFLGVKRPNRPLWYHSYQVKKFCAHLRPKFADCTIEWGWGGFKAPIYGGKFILFVGTTSNSFIVQDAFSERKAKFPLFITNKSWWQSWGCLVREFPSGSVCLLYHLIIYQCLSKQWCSGMKGWWWYIWISPPPSPPVKSFNF